MNVLTYFSFTLLSILIQLSVMDFLQNKLLLDEDKGVDLDLTSPKQQLNDVIKELGFIPHALYYHSQKDDNIKKIYEKTSLPDNAPSNTDTTTTLLDIILNDNSSIESSAYTTTDSEYTSIGFNNVTEMTLFVDKNETKKTNKPQSFKYNLDCDCNLLHEICDIKCCCDADCDSSLKEMFNCTNNYKQIKSNPIKDVCLTHLWFSDRGGGNIMDNMFCVVKTNLPERRNIVTTKYVITAGDQYLKWKQNKNPKRLKEFTKMQYVIGDPVYLLKNTSIYHMILPIPTVNSYCAGRKPIEFFKDEAINCIVKYEDLEMFNILRTGDDSTIISPKGLNVNTTALNCTSLHCTNWTVIVCDGLLCVRYNKQKPFCYEHTCVNVALQIDYVFHYYDSRISNVSVILHIQNISTSLTFMLQRINVQFLLANKTDRQNVIDFSGSPGYKKGLLLIVSSSEGNYTENFYQHKKSEEKYLSLPVNVNGQCVLPNSKQHFIQFGLNKRLKCRYFHSHNLPNNNVNVCKYIQDNITQLFRLNHKIILSPYGNPTGLADNDWIQSEYDNFDTKSVESKIDDKLYCYNVVSKISLTFVFTNMNSVDNNTILSLRVTTRTKNISFIFSEYISTTVTTDINFINISQRPKTEYAGRPHLNINVPKDFFFKHPSNRSSLLNSFKFNIYLHSILFICTSFLLQIK